MKFLTKNKVRKLSLFWLLTSISSYSQAIENTSPGALSPAQSVMPMLLGLAGILALIFFLAFLFKKITGINLSSKNIKLIESQSLGSKEKLMIVEIQKQQFVIGVTPHSISHICQLKDPVKVNTQNLSFENMMKQLISTQKKGFNLAERKIDEDKKC